MNIILALVALAGSTWALLKAIQTTRALEKKLKTLEAKLDKMNVNENDARCRRDMEGHSLIHSLLLTALTRRTCFMMFLVFAQDSSVKRKI